MTNEKSSLDKNLIADVVSKAMDNYLKTESDEESVVEDAVEPVESTELDDVVVNDDIKETSDVQEEVEEIVEEQVLQSGDYNFLGLDINITDDEEGKFNVVSCRCCGEERAACGGGFSSLSACIRSKED